MKLAALILMHRYPAQAEKLIDSLTEGNIDVFVHIDARAEKLFAELSAKYANKRNVIFLKKRYKVYWGSFNQIKATLELLLTAKKLGHYDYYSLLSGQDLPVKPLKEFHRYLEKNKGKEFLHWYKLPDHTNHSKYGGMDRMELYWLDVKPKFGYVYAKANDIVQKFQRRFKWFRKTPLQLYAGANWFTLTESAVNYITGYIEKNTWFLKMFRYTSCADEIFVQTLLLNSPLKEHIVNDCLRYIDWKSGPEYPRVLREEDYDKFVRAENKFFGRKFDETIDEAVIEKVTEKIK